MRKEHFKLIRRVVAATLLLPLLSSCSQDEVAAPDSPTRRPFTFSVTTDDYDGTRGTPITEMEQSIGMYAYTYEAEAWDDGGATAPNFMEDEEVQNTGTSWMTVGTYDPLDSRTDGNTARFYAYYPYGLPDSVFSIALSQPRNDPPAGAPILTYKVPTNVDDQIDLLAGGGEEFSVDVLSGGASPTISLKHLLAAVCVKVGECAEAGRIKSVGFKRVLMEDDYSLVPNTEKAAGIDGWTERPYRTANARYFKDITLPMNLQIKKAAAGATPQRVACGDSTFLMIPQTLPEGDSLVVVFNSGGSDHRLAVSMKGRKWLMGKTVTYTIDIQSLQRMTVKSAIEPWNASSDIQDGMPTDAVTIDLDADIDDWTKHEESHASDDPRE